ncbi:MAG: hypothetical protein IJR99_03435 [Kiritimatiellae bacterium]|nr:hypothetical protein [Kiritimatiellia bacterium]
MRRRSFHERKGERRKRMSISCAERTAPPTCPFG